jgi:hypothetical protein
MRRSCLLPALSSMFHSGISCGELMMMDIFDFLRRATYGLSDYALAVLRSAQV